MHRTGLPERAAPDFNSVTADTNESPSWIGRLVQTQDHGDLLANVLGMILVAQQGLASTVVGRGCEHPVEFCRTPKTRPKQQDFLKEGLQQGPLEAIYQSRCNPRQRQAPLDLPSGLLGERERAIQHSQVALIATWSIIAK